MPEKNGAKSNPFDAQTPASDVTPHKRRRADDLGEHLLPDMEHFVTLARRVKQPLRLLELVERICHAAPPQELQDFASSAKAALTPPQRQELYEWVVKQSYTWLESLEQSCSRIHALKDEFGIQAVLSLLDIKNPKDALALSEPTDRFTRPLYLFLAQEYPDATQHGERRFALAEWRQSLNHQWTSQDCASHFLGPKEARAHLGAEVIESLRARIAELYEGIEPQDILVQCFQNHDRSHASRHEEEGAQLDASRKLQHTITATFNGTKAFYPQVSNQEVLDREEPAALSVVFSWEPDTGMLGVFCKDKSLRNNLAAIFQKEVLSSDAAVAGMPMCSFDLKDFGSNAILNKISASLEDGVTSVSIQKIRLTNLRRASDVQSVSSNQTTQMLASHLEISRDRRDERDIYEVAAHTYKLSSFNADDISRVNLNIAVQRQTHRKAHNIAVQITLPNGLSSRCKTAQDRALMRQQLIRLGILTQVQVT